MKEYHDFFNDYLAENAIVYDDTEIRTAIIPKECLENAKYDLVLYSIIDVIQYYFEYELYDFARNYWTVTKHRLKNNPSTKKYIECYQFKVTARDGKQRPTDFLDVDNIHKILEYISYSKVIICTYPKMLMRPRVDAYTSLKEKQELILMINKYSLVPREDRE